MIHLYSLENLERQNDFILHNKFKNEIANKTGFICFDKNKTKKNETENRSIQSNLEAIKKSVENRDKEDETENAYLVSLSLFGFSFFVDKYIADMTFSMFIEDTSPRE